jgi:hypothetical protein
MKLMLQIAGGIVLGWAAVSAIRAVLAISAVSAFTTMPTAHSKPPIIESAPGKLQPAAPGIDKPMSKEQLDQIIPDESTRTHAEPDAAYAQQQLKNNALIRKATPEDAAAKPSR